MKGLPMFVLYTHIVVQVLRLMNANICEKYSYILTFLQLVSSYGLLNDKDTNYCPSIQFKILLKNTRGVRDNLSLTKAVHKSTI